MDYNVSLPIKRAVLRRPRAYIKKAFYIGNKLGSFTQFALTALMLKTYMTLSYLWLFADKIKKS